MSQCCGNEKLYDERFEQIDKKLERMENTQFELARVATLLELQIENGKDRDALIRDQSNTLVNINSNLESLSKGYENLSLRMETLEESSSINVGRLWKSLLTVGIPTVIGAIVIAGILMYLNWN